jgi:hypothetical protein
MVERDFTRVELRDLAMVEKHAREVLRQCEFLRENGGCDLIRFGLIAEEAWAAWWAAAKADRRAAKAHDWYALTWRLPRGYGSHDG